jgi:hypothetical protein
MNVGQFAAALRAAKAYKPASAVWAEPLAKLFSDLGKTSGITSFLSKLQKSISIPNNDNGDQQIALAQVRKELDGLRDIFEAAGAKAIAKDFQAVSAFLRSFDKVPLSEFIAHGEAAFQKQPKSGRAKPSSSIRQPQLAFIEAHLERLREAGTNRGAFDQALLQIKSDKKLKLAEHAEVARRYANTVTKYKSASSAHRDIQDAFIRQARFENKLQ